MDFNNITMRNCWCGTISCCFVCWLNIVNLPLGIFSWIKDENTWLYWFLLTANPQILLGDICWILPLCFPASADLSNSVRDPGPSGDLGLHLTSYMEPFNALYIFLHFKTSPYSLQSFRRMLQHCFESPEMFCWVQNFTGLSADMGLSNNWILIYGWNCPLTMVKVRYGYSTSNNSVAV